MLDSAELSHAVLHCECFLTYPLLAVMHHGGGGMLGAQCAEGCDGLRVLRGSCRATSRFRDNQREHDKDRTPRGAVRAASTRRDPTWLLGWRMRSSSKLHIGNFEVEAGVRDEKCDKSHHDAGSHRHGAPIAVNREQRSPRSPKSAAHATVVAALRAVARRQPAARAGKRSGTFILDKTALEHRRRTLILDSRGGIGAGLPRKLIVQKTVPSPEGKPKTVKYCMTGMVQKALRQGDAQQECLYRYYNGTRRSFRRFRRRRAVPIMGAARTPA